MLVILPNELLELANTVCKQRAEAQTIECKAAHVDCPKRLYDTLSAFSNQDSGGVLLFGIDEAAGGWICSAEIPAIDTAERPCYYRGAGRTKGS